MWVRAAAQKGCKMRWRGPSLVLFKKNTGSWHSVGIVACPLSTVASRDYKQQDYTRNIGPTHMGMEGTLCMWKGQICAQVPILDPPSSRALISTHSLNDLIKRPR